MACGESYLASSTGRGLSWGRGEANAWTISYSCPTDLLELNLKGEKMKEEISVFAAKVAIISIAVLATLTIIDVFDIWWFNANVNLREMAGWNIKF